MVPAVIIVLVCCLAGMQLATQNLRLQDAAATAARSAARGDPIGTGLVEGATIRVEHRGDLVCVTASAPGASRGGVIGAITVTASSCALDGGR